MKMDSTDVALANQSKFLTHAKIESYDGRITSRMQALIQDNHERPCMGAIPNAWYMNKCHETIDSSFVFSFTAQKQGIPSIKWMYS